MYTFVCAQEFKRSELADHYKNIHCEIHGGMNSYIEHRCPLAWMGCGFSSRRLYPHDLSHTLIYSPAVESFGVTQIVDDRHLLKKEDDDRCFLAELPLELLVKIVHLLDSFT